MFFSFYYINYYLWTDFACGWLHWQRRLETRSHLESQVSFIFLSLTIIVQVCRTILLLYYIIIIMTRGLRRIVYVRFFMARTI
jgi:hypothetical protein